MAAEPKREDPEPEPPTIIHRLREFEEHGEKSKEKKLKGASLAAHKPSYCLSKGIGDWHCGVESHRHHHRERLSRLLHHLVRQQNWAEASGVMSVLLQATATDTSISRNRAKYSIALELLNNVKGENISSRRIQGVYELWMKKLGHLKNWSTKERFAVQLEFILACLQRGSLEDAHQAAICVMQQPGFNSDPIANLMVGLVFYQLWYVDIPKELQLTDLDLTGTCVQPEVHNDDDIQMSGDFSVDNALEAGASYGRQCDSITSIAIDKVIEVKASRQNESMGVDATVKTEPSHSSIQSTVSQVEPDVSSENSEYSNYSGDLPCASVFYSKGLPRWLLPIKLPSSQENLEVALKMHRKLNKSHYKTALKCLRAAVYSTPPVLEAIHPYWVAMPMVALSESFCWSIAAKTYNRSTHIGQVIFQKPISSSCYQNRKENKPPLCDQSSRPNSSWYMPLDTCLVPFSDDSHKWPSTWPKRLTDKPPSLSVKLPDAEETYKGDTRHWSALVSEVYLGGLDLNWSNVRNVMDMNAGYGGFAAALINQPVWVMNVVPIHEPDTLAVIFDRGLIGVYHDWCESFNTYPRTYDLLQSSFLLANLTKRCDIIEVAAEMDRILRPGGYLVVQDRVELLNQIKAVLKSLHWSVSVHQDQFLVGKKGFWRPEKKHIP